MLACPRTRVCGDFTKFFSLSTEIFLGKKFIRFVQYATTAKSIAVPFVHVFLFTPN